MCKQRSISHKFVFLSKCFFDFSYYLPHLFISPFLFLSFCRFGLLLSSRSIDITTPERSTTIFRAEEFHCYRDPKKLSSLRYYSAAEVHDDTGGTDTTTVLFLTIVNRISKVNRLLSIHAVYCNKTATVSLITSDYVEMHSILVHGQIIINYKGNVIKY